MTNPTAEAAERAALISAADEAAPWLLQHGMPKSASLVRDMAAALSSHEALTARVVELEAALRFYASEWTVPAIGPRGEPEPTMRLERDQGATARRALLPTPTGDKTDG